MVCSPAKDLTRRGSYGAIYNIPWLTTCDWYCTTKAFMSYHICVMDGMCLQSHLHEIWFEKMINEENYKWDQINFMFTLVFCIANYKVCKWDVFVYVYKSKSYLYSLKWLNLIIFLRIKAHNLMACRMFGWSLLNKGPQLKQPFCAPLLGP